MSGQKLGRDGEGPPGLEDTGSQPVGLEDSGCRHRCQGWQVKWAELKE